MNGAMESCLPTSNGVLCRRIDVARRRVHDDDSIFGSTCNIHIVDTDASSCNYLELLSLG